METTIKRAGRPKLVLLLLTLAATAGCSKGPKLDATVEGSVTVDGELAKRGSVTFDPVGKGPVATGRIFADGSYRVGTGMGDVSNVDGGKLPAGKYVVTVVVSGESPDESVVAKGGPPLAGPRLSAAKYMDASTSDLKFTVDKGRNVFDLALVGAAADPPPPDEADDDAPQGQSDSGEVPATGDQTDDEAAEDREPRDAQQAGPADSVDGEGDEAASPVTPAPPAAEEATRETGADGSTTPGEAAK